MGATETTLKEIVWRIHVVPELAGCTIGFYGNGVCRIIGYPSCVTQNSENIAVIVEEVALTKGTSSQGANVEKPSHAETQQIVRNRSRLGPELIGAGIACTVTLASALGVVGGVAAEVPTGGASTFLVLAGWSGLVTGGIQCGNGLVRVGAIFADLEGDSLAVWDKNQIYSVAILIVDAIGVVGAVGSLPYAVRNLWSVISRMKAFNNAKLSFEALRAMNRVQRLKAISKLFQEASRTEDGTVALVTAAREAKIGAGTLQRSSGLSINHSSTLQRIIKEETVRRLEASLRDLFSNLYGLGASASPSSVTGSASGSINWVINLLDAGQPVS
jgi:hypothetical protein